MLTREEMKDALIRWQRAWDAHDLDGVMALFHEDVFFENWTGAKVKGKNALRRAWTSWFAHHGGFRFTPKEIFIDVEVQKVLYRWQLEWPSSEKGFLGQLEMRQGVDIIHFQDAQIIRKLTFTQTVIEIEGERVQLRP